MNIRNPRAIFWFAALTFFAGQLLAQRSNRGPAPPPTGEAKPAPRSANGTPDLSGMWVGGSQTEGGKFAVQVDEKGNMDLTRWGQEKITWNRGPENASAPGVYRGQHVRIEYDPLYHCYPPGLIRLGPPMMIISGGSGTAAVVMEFIHTPGKLMIVYQYRNSVRHIYLDGREHPKNVELSWNGHSVGKWEGDTLVVDTVGLRDESWLDTGGHEHSTDLHVVERFRRTDERTLEIERTLTDPVALAKPFTTKVTLYIRPEMDINENMDGRQFDCTQFMVRKPFFGEGDNGLLGVGEPTKDKY